MRLPQVISLFLFGFFRFAAGCRTPERIPASDILLTPTFTPMVTHNIPYLEGTPDNSRRKMDLYLPQATTEFPTLIFVSGGGWTTGSKDWVANVGRALAPHGIAVAIPDHRLIPEVGFQEQVADLALVAAWVKNHIADYGGDPSKIFVGGHSAGGHLISLLVTDEQYLEAAGLTTQDIVGAIPISGFFGEVNRLGPGSGPIEFVKPNLPDFLILYGAEEARMMVSTAEAMKTALENNRVPVEIFAVSNRDHFNIVSLIGKENDPTTARIVQYFFRDTKGLVFVTE